MNKCKTYIAIDLKSFYASVECRERNRDPLTTNLVVADPSRTEKTICLAVSPSRKLKAPNHIFRGSSDDSIELQKKTVTQDRLHNSSTTYGSLYGVQYKDL